MAVRQADEFAAMARALARQPDQSATWAAVVEQAVRTVEVAEHCTVMVCNEKRQYRTVAYTDPLALKIDQIQYQVGAGPCLTVLAERRTVQIDNVAIDQRWPAFSRRAISETPVLSAVTLPLSDADDATIGVLNLYSHLPSAFAQLDPAVLDALGTHCSIALAHAAERALNDHLRTALESNRDIGIAIGILMASRLVSKDQAFDLLRLSSQRNRRKVREIALDVIAAGRLPDPAEVTPA